MSKIIVQSVDENTKNKTPDVFSVKVIDEDGSETTHRVTLTDEYWHKLTKGSAENRAENQNEPITKPDLIKKSFQFLLERESASSILPKFSLPEIARYFPEFENEIGEYF